MVVECSLASLRGRLCGDAFTYYLTNSVSTILVVSCPLILIITCSSMLRLSHYFIVAIVLSSVCCFLLSFHIILLLVLPFMYSFFRATLLCFLILGPIRNNLSIRVEICVNSTLRRLHLWNCIGYVDIERYLKLISYRYRIALGYFLIEIIKKELKE